MLLPLAVCAFSLLVSGEVAMAAALAAQWWCMPAVVALAFGLQWGAPIALGFLSAALRDDTAQIVAPDGTDPVRRVMIYGAGQAGMAEARRLMQVPGISVIGFIDDNRDIRGLTAAGLPIHSGVEVGRVIRTSRVDHVVLALPALAERNRAYLEWRLDGLGCTVESVRPCRWATTVPGSVAATRQEPIGASGRRSLSGYRGDTVLVTGAGGTIGQTLCRQILTLAPARLVMLELNEEALYRIERDLLQIGGGLPPVEIVPVLGSVCDERLLDRLFAMHRIGTVLHAAAYKHVPMVESNPRAGLENNVMGTATLARKARDHGVGRFVLVSSDKAVRPEGVMGASKRLAECVIQDLANRSGGTIFSIVRFGNVLGSSGSVLPLFEEQIARGGPVTLTDPGATRYFMTIDNAVRLVLVASRMARGGEIHIFEMGHPVTIGQFARDMIAAAGLTVRDAERPDGDIEIVGIGLRPGEKMHEELTSGNRLHPTAQPGILLADEPQLSAQDISAALSELRDLIRAGCDAELRAAALRWARMTPCTSSRESAAAARPGILFGQCA